MFIRTVALAILLNLAIFSLSVSAEEVESSDPSKGASEEKYPSFVTTHDIRTPEDEFFYHYLEPLCAGKDLADWPIIDSLLDLGQDLVDARLWASIATETIYVSDQPRAKPLNETVAECSEILGIEPPKVYIKGDPQPYAYVSGLESPHVLVLSSELLALYQETPDELRFIIGNELGHIKAGHLRTHFLGRMLTKSIRSAPDSKATIADDFVASLTVHTLLHWFREAEFSADRAGLLCIGGDLNTAQQALLRLLHRTKPSNETFDADHPDFDPKLVLEEQFKIREKPFVEVFAYIREQRTPHPFIAERCAELEAWTLTSEYANIMQRDSQRKPSSHEVRITKIQCKGLPAVDTYIPLYDSGESDPFAMVNYAGKATRTKQRTDTQNPVWLNLTIDIDYRPGANVILEIYDYNAAFGKHFVGSCLIPVDETAPGKHQVERDLRLDIKQRSTIVDLPKVTLTYEIIDEQ